MAEKVTIRFVAETQAAGQKMRELGEKITGVGMRISAAFTLPLAGLFAALKNNEVFAKAFQPIQDAFSAIFNQFATALIPILNQLRPALIGLAGDIGGMLRSFIPSIAALVPTLISLLGTIRQVVQWFAGLSAPTKDAIVKFVAFAAILGPVLVALGQLLWLGGTLTQLMPALAAGIWATVAPVLALAAAVFALVKLVQMDEFKKLSALLIGGAVNELSGGAGNNARRGAAVQRAYGLMGGQGDTSTGDMVRGLFGGVGAPSSGSQVVIPVTYAPTLSTASQQELEKNLGPIIRDVVRQNPGR